MPGTTTGLALLMVNVTGAMSTGDYTTGNYTWLDLANTSGLSGSGAVLGGLLRGGHELHDVQQQ